MAICSVFSLYSAYTSCVSLNYFLSNWYFISSKSQVIMIPRGILSHWALPQEGAVSGMEVSIAFNLWNAST